MNITLFEKKKVLILFDFTEPTCIQNRKISSKLKQIFLFIPKSPISFKSFNKYLRPTYAVKHYKVHKNRSSYNTALVYNARKLHNEKP